MVCILCRYVPVLSIEVEVNVSAEVILLHGILFTLGQEVAISTCTNRNGEPHCSVRAIP